MTAIPIDLTEYFLTNIPTCKRVQGLGRVCSYRFRCGGLPCAWGAMKENDERAAFPFDDVDLCCRGQVVFWAFGALISSRSYMVVDQ